MLLFVVSLTAKRAKTIKIRAEVNQNKTDDLVKALRQEIESLTQQLEEKQSTVNSESAQQSTKAIQLQMNGMHI